MRPSSQRRSLKRGFTFVEILAAMVFMAVLLPAVVRGITLANRVGVSAERRRVAAQLVEQIMIETVATEDWMRGSVSGDFGIEFTGYSYEITETPWLLTELRELTARVYYTVQDRQYFVELTTVVDASEDSVVVTSGGGAS